VHPRSALLICRDRGRGGEDEGAWCLSWWQHDTLGLELVRVAIFSYKNLPGPIRCYDGRRIRASRGNETMGYDPEKHHRRSIRLKGYDYSQPGAYFVTICSWQRQPLFDRTALRNILVETWQQLPARYANLSLDTFVVMPDHIHGILHLISPLKQIPGPTFSDIMRVYKSIASVSWIR
jgi:hypothetical protein